MSYNQEIYFNGKAASEYGIRVWAPPSISIPEKRVEEVEIPGRMGSAIMDDGFFKNVERKYKVSVYHSSAENEGDYYKNYAKLAEWLHSASGYLRLEDTYEPDVYRYARIKNGAEVVNMLNTVGVADLVFSCQPRAYLKQLVNGQYTDWVIHKELTQEEMEQGSVMVIVNNTITKTVAYPNISMSVLTDAGPLTDLSIKTLYNGTLHLLSNMNDDPSHGSSPNPWDIDWGIEKVEVNSENQSIVGEKRNLRRYYPLSAEFPELYYTESGRDQQVTVKFTYDGFSSASLDIVPNFWRL